MAKNELNILEWLIKMKIHDFIRLIKKNIYVGNVLLMIHYKIRDSLIIE